MRTLLLVAVLVLAIAPAIAPVAAAKPGCDATVRLEPACQVWYEYDYLVRCIKRPAYC